MKITKILEDNGYQVFLPQRDGFLATDMEGKTEDEKQIVIERRHSKNPTEVV